EVKGLSSEDTEDIAVLNKLDHILSEASDLVLENIRSLLLNTDMYIEQFYGNEIQKEENHSKENVDALKEIKFKERKKIFDTHLFIYESLMKKLLQTDGIECPPGADNARALRKKVVRQLQSWMDQVDAAKQKILSLEESERVDLIEKRYRNQL
ncbi:hypothetical protein BB560_005206, partial [Smittium megazygosporum]